MQTGMVEQRYGATGSSAADELAIRRAGALGTQGAIVPGLFQQQQLLVRTRNRIEHFFAEPRRRHLVLAGRDDPARAVKVGVSSEELTPVLICALFFVVASMMHEARRIAEDNAGFV